MLHVDCFAPGKAVHLRNARAHRIPLTIRSCLRSSNLHPCLAYFARPGVFWSYRDSCFDFEISLANLEGGVNLFCCSPDTAREMAQQRSLSAISACWATGSGGGVSDEILVMCRI
jgi:hypothetical protein